MRFLLDLAYVTVVPFFFMFGIFFNPPIVTLAVVVLPIQPARATVMSAYTNDLRRWGGATSDVNPYHITT